MSKQPLRLPTLHILEIKADRLVFSFNENTWMGEHYIACIMPVFGTLLWGRFNQLDFETKIGQFIFDRSYAEPKLEVAKEYEYLDGYWGELTEIVFGPYVWQLKEFVARDAIFHSEDGTTKEIPGGWDHEHCLICGETIGNCGQIQGYVNQKYQWVCQTCYQCYVVPKCLDFINIS